MPIARRFCHLPSPSRANRIADYRGVIRGITVRSRKHRANIGAGIQTLSGQYHPLFRAVRAPRARRPSS